MSFVIWTELLLLLLMLMVEMCSGSGLLLVLHGSCVVLENLLVLQSLVELGGWVWCGVCVAEKAIHAKASAERQREG